MLRDVAAASASRSRLQQLRLDLASVIAGFRGERPPGFLRRDGSRYPSGEAPTRLATREIEITEVVRETPDAVSLVFRSADGQPLPAARPGQFFTLQIERDGEVLRRAYSISSDCRTRDRYAVTVKRVAGGKVSTYLNDPDQVGPGLRLRALGPSGEFGVAPEPSRATPRKLVLIAGGSGITPMMAMIRSLLPVEADTRIALIYANRSAEQVIFADALARLAAEHGERLRVTQTLEQAPAGWTGAVGRADAETLATLLAAEPLAADADAEFMLCGPAPMMDAATEVLRERLAVAPERIHRESFLAPHLASEAQAELRTPQPVTVAIGGREVGLVVQPTQTLLEAGLAAGLAMPYSCAMGGCAACKVQLERGRVVMREPNCLSPAEQAAGYVLACVANPTEPCRVRVG